MGPLKRICWRVEILEVYSINNRWRVLCNWISVLLVPILFLGASLLLAVESGREGDLGVYASITFLVLFTLAYLAYFLSIAIRKEWFAAEYEITSETLVQRYPSGKRITAEWENLVRFDGIRWSFIFSDGTKIELPRYYPIFARRVLRASCRANTAIPELRRISEELERSRESTNFLRRNIVFLILSFMAVLGILVAILR